jgi:hypothetical protein
LINRDAVTANACGKVSSAVAWTFANERARASAIRRFSRNWGSGMEGRSGDWPIAPDRHAPVNGIRMYYEVHGDGETLGPNVSAENEPISMLTLRVGGDRDILIH